MKVITLAEALPVLTEISQRLEKLSRIEQLIERRSTTCAAAIRDCRAGIKASLAGMLNRMEDPNVEVRSDENLYAE